MNIIEVLTLDIGYKEAIFLLSIALIMVILISFVKNEPGDKDGNSKIDEQAGQIDPDHFDNNNKEG